MKSIIRLAFFLLIYMSCTDNGEIIPVKKTTIKMINDYTIYSSTKHSAFTCINEYEECKVVAFREGDGHRPQTSKDYGHVVILQEVCGNWNKIAELYQDDMDLRDPFIVKIDGHLRVYCGYNQFLGESKTYQHSGTAYADLTEQGWTKFKQVNHDANHVVWIWKIRKYNESYYGVGYLEGYKPILFSSVDGIEWKTVCEFDVEGVVSEADIAFISDNMYVCLRKDQPLGSPSLWGRAKYPFVEFEWKEMSVSIASPEMIISRKMESILLGGRQYVYNREGLQDSIKVSLFETDKEGNVNLIYTHASSDSGDKGYPSILVKDEKIYMSYYEGTTSQAEIRLATFYWETK